MNCKNCDAVFEGNFCPNCGQKSDTHRITFGHFLHEFFHAFTHTDKGILLLMRSLIARPGHVAREYLDGKRKKYFNPLSFLVIISSVYAYVAYKTGYFEVITRQQGPARHPVHAEVMQIMLNNGKTINLFLMPVLMSLFSTLFFWRSKTNLTENFVLNSFVMGQIYTSMILIFMPAFLLFPESIRLNNQIFHALMLVYLVVAYRQFFKNNIVLTTLKSALIIVLFIVFFWLSIVAYVLIKNWIIG